MNKLRGITLPKKWLEFDEIKDKVVYPTTQNKIEQLEKYIEVREQECDELQDRIDKAIEYIKNNSYTAPFEEIVMFTTDSNPEKLLNILKGDNK